MNPPRRIPLCDVQLVNGMRHRLERGSWKLTRGDGATYRLCGPSCLIMFLTQPGPAWQLAPAFGDEYAAIGTAG